MNKRNIILIVVAVVAVAIIAMKCSGKKNEQGVGFETMKVSRTDITTSVTATGTVEAVTTVTVGTQVSGILKHLYVDYNSPVRKGQVIAELDRTNLETELASAQANLRSAEADLQYQQKNYARYSELNQKQLVSANEYDVALQSYRRAQESVRVAQQSVNRARTNLGYATIYSPIDGIIISKEVEEGQTVASSFNTPTLFTIAKDLSDMQVIANVDEADIGNVKEGQRVTFAVDAFPDDTFNGTVRQVRQKATTTNNVVTYEVVISAPNGDLKLKPGLTANVTIYTLERNDVLAVPSKALRFTPNEALLKGDQQIADVEAPAKVWTLEGNTFKAHRVETGVSNGMMTEIVSGVKEGTEILVDFNISGGEAPQQNQASNPFMPRPRNNRQNNQQKK